MARVESSQSSAVQQMYQAKMDEQKKQDSATEDARVAQRQQETKQNEQKASDAITNNKINDAATEASNKLDVMV
ncbi:MAG: hypothetical protein PHE67_05435 [Campylobacterales bacterium]|nr:hypothetical protein [Campylobacterales bacterium]